MLLQVRVDRNIVSTEPHTHAAILVDCTCVARILAVLLRGEAFRNISGEHYAGFRWPCILRREPHPAHEEMGNVLTIAWVTRLVWLSSVESTLSRLHSAKMAFLWTGMEVHTCTFL